MDKASIILIKVGILYFVVFFTAASLLYFSISLLFSECIFGTFEGSSSYHCLFPYQYIGVLTLMGAIVISIWAYCCKSAKSTKKYFSLFIAFILIIFLSSFFGGVLWAIHDIQVEQTMRGMNMAQFFSFHISRSMTYGWIALIRSFPFNFVALIVGVLLVQFLTSISSPLFKR